MEYLVAKVPINNTRIATETLNKHVGDGWELVPGGIFQVGSDLICVLQKDMKVRLTRKQKDSLDDIVGDALGK